MQNILLVYPEFPPSYWGFKFALKFVGKKSAMPPLGLLTVAGLFPERYRLRLVDMNVQALTDEDLRWADLVFTSTMIVQRDSLRSMVKRCKEMGVPVVAGGPHPTSFHQELDDVDYLVLDEVEEVLPEFLRDLESGRARRVYRAERRPEMDLAPLPRFDLIRLEDYGSMALQFSRGCPFDCEFCDITKLFGRSSRTKTPEQMLTEFDQLYRLGWRGNLFLVDDNFIGNKREALSLLPLIAQWQQERSYPFSLFTEASVNLAKLDPLMDAMVEAGFSMVFLGIETPNPEALLKTKKKQNTKKGEEGFLFNAVRAIQQKGMEVTGGFILGLDGDGPGVFDSQIEFIQEAGIPMAMTGLLSALKGTDLYERLKGEGRLLEESSGNNVSVTLNFQTEMDRQVLVDGYKKVLTTLYDKNLRNYFRRCETLLDHLTATRHFVRPVGKTEVSAALRSLFLQLFSRQGPCYGRFLLRVLFRYPRMLPEAFRLGIMGYHFEKITSHQIAVHDFKLFLEAQLEALGKRFAEYAKISNQGTEDARAYVQEILDQVHTRYDSIHHDFRYAVAEAFESFERSIRNQLNPDNS